ncbi:putative transposase [Escherichia coli 5-172-05_S4_C2]|nr:putative transposase [Escherichia coli 5-172-05_S4_C2]
MIVCAEMDEQWGYVGAKSRQRWLFYAYDRIRRTVVAHVFGERTLATLGKRKANAVCNTCSLQTKLELLLN